MSTLPILRRRRERRENERQQSESRTLRSFMAAGLMFVMGLALAIFGGALTYSALTANLPSADLLPAFLDANGSMLEPTRIYDRSGQHLLAVLSPKQQDSPRNYIPLDPNASEHLPEALAQATLALADPDQRTGPGYSLNGLLNFDHHPTLAQTLTARFLLWDEPAGLARALRERILAGQITTRFGREKILEWYLNTANYGHFAYGADAAAQFYFGKPAARLNLAESALLAAVSQAPAINPLDAPNAVMEHQHETLDKMLRLGFITQDEYTAARATALTVQKLQPPAPLAPAFVTLALEQLARHFDRARIESGGMRVITTLDYDLQVNTTCALQTQLGRLSGQNVGACSGAESLPALPPGLTAEDLAGSALVLDPQSGQILAAVGEMRKGQESAFLTGHRPGTLLTPFLYLAGFTRSLGPASLVWDIPLQGTLPLQEPPATQEANPSTSKLLQNPDGKFHGPIRLRTALTNDYLVPAGQVFTQMGAPLVAQTMRPFGFDIPTSNASDLLDGPTRFSLFDVAQAYGVFATQGIRISAARDTSAVLRVEGSDYRAYLDFTGTEKAQVVSPQLAYLITDILGRPNPLEINIPSASKTGQTLDGHETWAVGYTPHRVAVIWLENAPGSAAAAGLWTAVMRSASRGQASDGWKLPDGVLRMKVCDPSGMLPTPSCPNLADEVFVEGFQPTQTDTLYQPYTVNRETGLLATIFTAPQLLEERVYMQVPPEAQAWADSGLLTKPPTAYDTIQKQPSDPNINISSPVMFAELTGKVSIEGTATGDDMIYYRLQYGPGLNPQTWSQIGKDNPTPQPDGTLADWDTSGLNGLYALQLLIVHRDNSITTSTVMVLVKN